MKSPVVIKGNKMGIRLIIAPEASIYDITRTLEAKLQNTKHYYKSIKPITVTFDGKTLTKEESNEIFETLIDTGLNIRMDNDNNKPQPEEINTKQIEKTIEDAAEKDGLFYIGNLKCGQTIEALGSIVIVGDIEPGASVLSTGNIIVIGQVRGYAQAGSSGREDAFVYSMVSRRKNK